MARTAQNKGQTRSSTSTVSSASSPSTRTTAKSSSTEPPAPYIFAPIALKPFLAPLDPQHVYIVHLDTHRRAYKLRIFVLPILINTVVLALLCWRAWAAFPYYSQLLMAIWGYDSPYRVNTRAAPWSELANELTSRTGILMVDFFLLRFLGPWPLAFFWPSSAGPLGWRWCLGGARDVEVVVRQSRGWDRLLGPDWLTSGPGATTGSSVAASGHASPPADKSAESKVDGRPDSAAANKSVYAERILPALNRRWIRQKTGYLMLDRNWDLDFAAMSKAQHLVDRGALSLDHFRKQVLVYSAVWGWLQWPVWQLDATAISDEVALDPTTAAAQKGSTSTSAKAVSQSGTSPSVDAVQNTSELNQEMTDTDLGRQKIELLHAKLTALGQEALFYRWIELLQFETSQPGGFTAGRQAHVLKEGQALFRARGLDFDRFWSEMKTELGVE